MEQDDLKINKAIRIEDKRLSRRVNENKENIKIPDIWLNRKQKELIVFSCFNGKLIKIVMSIEDFVYFYSLTLRRLVEKQQVDEF